MHMVFLFHTLYTDHLVYGLPKTGVPWSWRTAGAERVVWWSAGWDLGVWTSGTMWPAGSAQTQISSRDLGCERRRSTGDTQKTLEPGPPETGAGICAGPRGVAGCPTSPLWVSVRRRSPSGRMLVWHSCVSCFCPQTGSSSDTLIVPFSSCSVENHRNQRQN